MPLVCGLRRLGAGVVDVLHGQVELILVAVVRAAILGATIGQHPVDADPVLVEERDHPVIQQVGGGERRLAGIELGEADLGVGVDHRLLVDAAHALERADVEGVLRQAIAGMLALELAMGFLVELGLLQRDQLASVSTRPSWATLASSAFRRFFIVSRSCRSQMLRTPKGETSVPRFFNSLAARAWPHAGFVDGHRHHGRFHLRRGAVLQVRLRLRVISASARSPPFS